MAADELADLVAVDANLKKITAELKTRIAERGSSLLEVHGIGPAGAARTIADVGDIARFTDRNRFASLPSQGPAPHPSTPPPVSRPDSGSHGLGTGG